MQVHADRFACREAPALALDPISPNVPSPDDSDGRWNSSYLLKSHDGARRNPAWQVSAPRPASRILLGTELPCYLAWIRKLEGTWPQSYARRCTVGIGCRAGCRGSYGRRSVRHLQPLLDHRHAFLHALAQRPFNLLLPLARRKHFVRDVQRREHGYLQRIHHVRRFGDRPHLAVNVSGQLLQILLILLAIHVVKLIINLNFHVRLPPSQPVLSSISSNGATQFVWPAGAATFWFPYRRRPAGSFDVGVAVMGRKTQLARSTAPSFSCNAFTIRPENSATCASVKVACAL